jgi:hypothetical protein
MPCFSRNSCIRIIALTSPRNILRHDIFVRNLALKTQIPAGIFQVGINNKVSILHIKFWIFTIRTLKKLFELFFFNLVNWKFVEPNGGSFWEICFSIDLAWNILIFRNLCENWDVLLWLFIQLIDWLWFGQRGDLGYEMIVTESDLFDESIGSSFLNGFSTGFGFFVFILVRKKLL